MSTLFDPTSFLNSPLPEANATKRIPLPVADAVPAQIIEQKMVTGEQKKGENAGKSWFKLEIKCEITDREYLDKATGQPEKAIVTYGVMIDMNEGGGMAFGENKNVQLGKLRAATGCNEPGKTLAHMVGRMVRLKIGHRPDADNSDIVYEDVKGVAPF